MDHPTQAAPEPTPDPKTEPTTTEPAPTPAEPTPPAPTPTSATDTAPAATPETEAPADTSPTAEAIPTTEAKPAIEAEPTTAPKPPTNTTPVTQPAPTSEPTTEPEPATQPATVAEPAEPEPSATTEPTTNPAPATEPPPATNVPPAAEIPTTAPDSTPETPDPAESPAPQPALEFATTQDPTPNYDLNTIPLPLPIKPPRPTEPRDPLAVALGNGSLLGIGYGTLGRRALTTLTILITVVLVTLLATTIRTLWFEIVVLAWWLAVIAHGWFLATKQPRPTAPGEAKRQRLVALAVTLPIILIIGVLRYDSARIENAVADARQSGDCTQAMAALDDRWAGHRIADAPLSVKGDDTVDACEQLRKATANLDGALTGDAGALRAGIGRLRSVLNNQPGHEVMVEQILDRFLDRLPTDDACATKVLTDWLGHAPRDRTVLDRAVDVVPRIAPDALVECGDKLMTASDWTLARERYQQLLDEYPDHDLAPRAQEGVTKATQAIELAKVRQLLTPSAGAQPAYCTTPAPYSGAVAYGATRPNRALYYGNDEYTNRLPAEWKATDAADAVLIVCAGATEFGTPVETCPYESTLSVFGYTDVTFKRVAIPVRVFEVKTGRLVTETRVEIGGASCPAILQYQTSSYVDFGPPSEVYVTPGDPDVHAGFAPLITP